MGDTNPASNRLGKRPALDGLRGVAVLAVLAYHRSLLPAGFVGVDVFFVLSGFLITTLLLEEESSTGRIRLGAFYARRIIRLAPAVVVLFAVLWLAVFVLGSRFQTDPRLLAQTTAITLLYGANWVLALNLTSWPAPLLHLWSLAIEEQFYLIWPPIVALVIHRFSTRSLFLTAVTGVAIVVPLRIALQVMGAAHARIYFGTDTRADGLLIGCALAIALKLWPQNESERRTVPTVAGFALLVLLFATGNDARDNYWWIFVAANTASALLLYGCLGFSTLRSALFENKQMVWIGRRSYGIYLWHVPVYYLAEKALPGRELAVTVGGAIATIAVAAASFAIIESPLLRQKKRFATRPGAKTIAAEGIQ